MQNDLSRSQAASRQLSDCPVKVLHIINGQHFAGAERVQAHLGHCLPKLGIHADFACLSPGRFPALYESADSKVFDVAMNGRLDFSAVSRARDLVRRGQYNLLHAHTPRSAMITAAVARLTGTPWVYHVHSPAANDSTRRIQNQVNSWVERASLRSVAHQIAVSQSLRQQTVQSGYASDRVSLVHNGVPGTCKSRERHPQPGASWTLGMIALHRPRKGLEVLIDALSMVRQQGLDIRLRCIGPFETQDYEKEIMRRVQDAGVAGAIQFTGFTDDVPGVLTSLDAMVLPSLFGEGLPMVVLEAMAAGLPVIATRVEGTPEAVRHDREGLLAEAGCPTSLSLQIERLVRGDVSWKALSESAQRRHDEKFSDMAMAKGVAEVYRQVLAA